ncbi:MAG: 5'/3'-nucleotidase SurE [Bacteroidales bacterium]|nr:5'/3'-nucleotidase SurE [Bacteroidales bacterium]
MQTENERPLIVVTNDDGYMAKGIAELAEVAQEFGETVVVAPELHYSGASHSVSMNVPMRVKYQGKKNGVDYYTINGTPVDCVKMAKFVVLGNRKIDMLLSGINHGHNAAVSVIYSGTVAAAAEAAMEKYKSIGFSYSDYDSDADFTTAKHFARQIIKRVLESEDYPRHISLNVNIPKLPIDQVKGIKVVRQANGFWNDAFVENVDPMGQKYYWLTGKMEDREKKPGTCLYELANGYVTVQPVHTDLTAFEYIDPLKNIIE